MVAPYFYVYKDTAGQWRWRFVASNGEPIANGGEGYKNLSDCLHGIDLVKGKGPAAPVNGDDNYKAAKSGGLRGLLG